MAEEVINYNKLPEFPEKQDEVNEIVWRFRHIFPQFPIKVPSSQKPGDNNYEGLNYNAMIE